VKVATTGLCFDNQLFVLDTSTVAGLLINSAMLCIENYANNAVTKAPIVVPFSVST